MKFLKEKEYTELLMKSKERLPLRAKLDKINILIEEYEHGKNIYTIMRDIKDTIRERWKIKMLDKYQQEIVDSNEPRIIVEAGAGSR